MTSARDRVMPNAIIASPTPAFKAIGACCPRFRAMVIRMNSEMPQAVQSRKTSARATARLSRAAPAVPGRADCARASCACRRNAPMEASTAQMTATKNADTARRASITNSGRNRRGD